MNVVIEMCNVTVGAMRNQNVLVAEGINWTVNAGELWAVAGPQRSGKTDFLMMTGGLMPPTQGVYRLFGAEMPIFEEERLPERLRIGLVFDGGQLFSHMTIAENVALPLRYHKDLPPAEAESRVRELLEITELLPFADRSPVTLARNWQKRAGLARALMLPPDVLLLDNPLARLDARHTNWWLTFLAQLSRGETELCKKKMTLVATSESLRTWRHHGSHFALLNEGHFTILGRREALEASSDALVQELLATELPAGGNDTDTATSPRTK